MPSSAYEVIGVGVDLLKVSRIQKLCARARHRSQRSLPMQSSSYASNGDERFAAKILNRQEKEAYDAAFPVSTTLPRLAERAQYLAVRWGLKEAAFKAAFPHHRLTWHQMIVTKTEGTPKTAMLGGSIKQYGVRLKSE